MSDVERDPEGNEQSLDEEGDGRTASGEPLPDASSGGEAGGADADVEEDPETGSSPTDPAVEDTGLPPAGRDPMAGESPSG